MISFLHDAHEETAGIMREVIYMYVRNVERMSEIGEKLESISTEINEVTRAYIENHASYGWDDFAETLANVSAQLYMAKIKCDNAKAECKPFAKF